MNEATKSLVNLNAGLSDLKINRGPQPQATSSREERIITRFGVVDVTVKKGVRTATPLPVGTELKKPIDVSQLGQTNPVVEVESGGNKGNTVEWYNILEPARLAKAIRSKLRRQATGEQPLSTIQKLAGKGQEGEAQKRVAEKLSPDDKTEIIIERNPLGEAPQVSKPQSVSETTSSGREPAEKAGKAPTETSVKIEGGKLDTGFLKAQAAKLQELNAIPRDVDIEGLSEQELFNLVVKTIYSKPGKP